MIALDPAAHLALQIALRLAKIGESSRCEVDPVQLCKIVDERLAKFMGYFRGQLKARGRVSTENDSANGFHQVKGSPEDGSIVAIEQNLWGRGIRIVKFREDVELASHVMSTLYLAAERRAAQDHLPIAKLHAISEVGMPTRKLRDAEAFCLAGKMGTEKRFEFATVEFLARSDESWLVSEVRHFRLLLHGLSIGQQCFFVQMWK